jgi:hypothetical protein
MSDYSENMRKSITLTSISDTYEIKIGNTTFVISHGYGKSDLSEIITDYLSEKTMAQNMKKAA